MTNKRKPQPWAEDKMEYKEYQDKLSPEERKWIKKFYQEYYNNGVYNSDDPILNSEELKKEAKRNYNNLSRDALELIGRQDTYGDFSEVDRHFMEEASDEIEWRDAYKMGGKEVAGDAILMLAINELESTDTSNWPPILIRMHIRLRYLERMVRKERRK